MKVKAFHHLALDYGAELFSKQPAQHEEGYRDREKRRDTIGREPSAQGRHLIV